MLVLVTTCLVTINVKADSYVTDDTYIISSQYHDFFKNYFGDNKKYQYFSYKCNAGSYQRNCYYGIDSESNYIKVEYVDNDSYSYNQKITIGIDENFSVSGNVIFIHEISSCTYIFYLLIFILVLFFICVLIGGL